MLNKTILIKNYEDAEDFAQGCTFFGTGGGGDYQEGYEALCAQLEKNNEISCVNINTLKDKGFSCCPFLMGSIAPEDEVTVRERETIYELGPKKYNYTQAMIGAVENLEKMTGQPIDVLVPIELGGANTASCLAAAAEMGKIVIDGDYTGRAIPEIQQTTPFIFEKELLPIASFDCWGSIASITAAENWRMAERIGKLIAAGGYSQCAQAGFLIPVSEMKQTALHGTLSECLKAGRVIRRARKEKVDPAKLLVKELGGWIIFRGEVSEKEWEDRNGYYWGTHTITGCGKYEGHELKIWFKNENHLSWLDGNYYISSPDMIQVIDSETGKPYTNNCVKIGQKVTVIGMRAREAFRTERGLKILSPQAFGYNYLYRYIEDIINIFE